jgi:hypothetical protein
MVRTSQSSRLIPLLAIGFLVAGCAGTGGSHKLVTPPLSQEQATKYPDLIVAVESTPEIPLTATDKDRILQLILNSIQEESPDRFTTINASTPMPGTLHVAVTITRYDEGNAFARFMLAGLGQMHIDADVVLTDESTKEKLAQYEVTKTFAWGGIYGAATNIKGIEEGFAKAVAASILGKDE